MHFDEEGDYVLDSDIEEDDIDVSSEDEIDIFLQKTLGEKLRKSSDARIAAKESSSEDEFEKQMNQELSSTLKLVEAARNTSEDKPSTSSKTSGKKQEEQCYDNDYFDSDSDEEYTSKDKKVLKRKVLTNDELLYDPEMDNEDQKWVDEQRRKNSQPSKSSKSSPIENTKLPASDAVLNCPACMVTLCRDCQRHDIYKNQYRAIFVLNCKVMTEEILKCPKVKTKASKKKRKNKKRTETDIESTSEEVGSTSGCKDPNEEGFHPVRCKQCNTEVGVYDKEEIYHFFNVLSSYT